MRVVPAFEPFEDRHTGPGLGLEATAVQHFAFEHREEALGHGVIVRIAASDIVIGLLTHCRIDPDAQRKNSRRGYSILLATTIMPHDLRVGGVGGSKGLLETAEHVRHVRVQQRPDALHQQCRKKKGH